MTKLRSTLAIVLASLALAACSSQEEPSALQLDGMCEEPRPEICTMQYEPVCAEVGGELKEYGNACSACGDPEVSGYAKGACPIN